MEKELIGKISGITIIKFDVIGAILWGMLLYLIPI